MANLSVMTKHQRFVLARIVAGLSAAALLFSLSPQVTFATGVLTTPRIYLGREQAGLTTGESFQIFFTPATAVSGGAGNNKVILVFTGANGTWCNTVGTGDLVVTGIANPTGATESATSLPGASLTGACTKNPDTFTLSGVNNLSGGGATKYGVQVVEASSTKIGSASAANDIQVTIKTNNGSADVDTGTLALSTITSDQVAVTATVNPSLTVTLSPTSAALGTLDLTHVNQAGVTSTVTTNASSGYNSSVKYDATLTSGSDTIGDASGGTIVAGTDSEFGASSSQSGNTIAQWNPTSCSTTTTTSNATALSTSFKTFASGTGPVNAEGTTLCFLAGINVSTKAGSYTSTATVVATAKF